MSSGDPYEETPVDLNLGVPHDLVPGRDTDTQALVWIWCPAGPHRQDDARLMGAISEAAQDWERHPSPNALTSLGCHRVQGRPAWVFERLPGDGALSVNRDAFSASEALQVGLDLASALRGLHEAGASHGDVRPGRLVWGLSLIHI